MSDNILYLEKNPMTISYVAIMETHALPLSLKRLS